MQVQPAQCSPTDPTINSLSANVGLLGNQRQSFAVRSSFNLERYSMRKALILAVLAPLAASVAIAPALAETTIVKKSRGEFGGRKKVVIKKHGNGTTVKKVIKHDD